MTKKVHNSIPVIFQKIKNYELEDYDSRFQKVKIWLMHLGENYNQSYFSREVVEAAIPSLANTPILAYIEKNKDGESDFSDHRMVVTKKDGVVSTSYLGKPIGVIPEDNNARFEDRLCDDGQTRTFLTVEGLLWSKIDDAIDIMNRDSKKAQSIELHEDYEGRFEDDNLFHFTKFSFYGACGLGVDVSPAMQNSTIELQFSLEDFKKEMNAKVEEFKKHFTAESMLEQDTQSSVFSIDNTTDTNINEQKEDKLVPEIKTKLEIATQYSLTTSQLYDELDRVLSKETYTSKNWYGDEYEASKFYLRDFDESFVYAVNRQNGYIDVKIPYSMDGDNVVYDFENVTRIKYTPTDWDGGSEELEVENYALKIIKEGVQEFSKVIAEKEELSNQLAEKAEALLQLNEQFTAKQTELDEKQVELDALQQFKQQVSIQERKEKVDALLSRYEKHLSKEEVTSFLEKETSIEVFEDFEKEVKLFVADKVAEQVVNTDTSTNFSTMDIPVEPDEKVEFKNIWDRLESKKQ